MSLTLRMALNYRASINYRRDGGANSELSKLDSHYSEISETPPRAGFFMGVQNGAMPGSAIDRANHAIHGLIHVMQ